MAFGVKTNEQPGTRAQVRYSRMSATKAREVLDLVRGCHVSEADEILRFVERDSAIVIRKVLASAVANAQANDELDPETLYVSACFADEGPTLKRWRPRARGRATRIRKRTCHITVIVSRLPPAELERWQSKQAQAATPTGRARRRGGATADRRARVARSRQKDAGAAPVTDEEAAEVEEEETSLVPGEPTDASIEAAEAADADLAGDADLTDRAVDDVAMDEPVDGADALEEPAVATSAEAEIATQDAAAEAAGDEDAEQEKDE